MLDGTFTLFSWPGRVLAHVDALAVVQVPGGMLVARDPHAMLQDGTDVQVQATDRGHAVSGVVLIDTFNVEQRGQIALLRSNSTRDACPHPLLLRPREQLPALFTLSIPVDPPEQNEGADPLPTSKPFDPSGCTCPDIDPAAVHASMLRGNHL